MLIKHVWHLPYIDSFDDEWTDEEYDSFLEKYEPIVTSLKSNQGLALCLWLYDSDMPLVICDLIEEASRLSDQECLDVFKEYLENEEHAWMRDDYDDLYEEALAFVNGEV